MKDFIPFVGDDGIPSLESEVRYPARIAVYDDPSVAPQVLVIEPTDIRSYLSEITNNVTRLSHERGGRLPFTIIREIVENYIHASFIEPSISIFDDGNTIRFCDQGPGIPEKQRALEIGTTSASEDMKHYIRGVGSGLPIALQYPVNCLNGDVGTQVHQSVVDIFHISIVGNGKRLLQDDTARVDVVIEEERGHSCHGLAIDDRPVDGCSTTVLRQQGGMYIEGAEAGHVPHHLGQHAEGHHHLYVGMVGAQLFYELGVFHLHRLEHGQGVGQRIALHLGGLQRVLMPAHWFVGLCDHSHHVVSTFHKPLQRSHSKLGRSHKHDSQFFFLHGFAFSSFVAAKVIKKWHGYCAPCLFLF